MLTKEALLELKLAPALIEAGAVLDAQTTKRAMVLPDGFNIHSLEQFNNNASHYRMSYRTHSLYDFVYYIGDHVVEGTKESSCFISDDEMSARAVIDLGSQLLPGHKFHTATIVMRKTAAFCAVIALSNKVLSQKDIADFIEEYADYISVFDGNNTEMSHDTAAGRLRSITIETAKSMTSNVGNFSNQMSAMELVEAASIPTIPHRIEFSCQTYCGLTVRTFKLTLSILTNSDKPTFKVKFWGRDMLDESLVDEFKNYLLKALQGTMPIYIGSY